MVDFAVGDPAIHRVATRRAQQVRRESGMFDVSHLTVGDLTARGAAVPPTWSPLVAKVGESRGKRCNACSTAGGVHDDIIIIT